MSQEKVNKCLRIRLALLSLLVLLATDASAAPGDLDPTFGVNGRVVDWTGWASDVAIQADGKFVVVGGGGIARYQENGSADTTFGVDGKVTAPAFHWLTSVAIQQDQKIIVAGFNWHFTPLFALVRYEPDGSLDQSFGLGGIVTTPRFDSDDFAEDVIIQPDGKIIAVGCTTSLYDAPCNNWALARYRLDGSLDPAFGSGGRVITTFPPTWTWAALYSGALQPDGKIVAAGYLQPQISGVTSSFAVVRYNADGSLDTTFDSDGFVTTPIPGGGRLQSVAIQPDGKIVATGGPELIAGHPSQPSSAAHWAVVRYNANGSLDTTFDGDGIVTTPATRGSAHAIAVQPDGRLVTAGEAAGVSGQKDFSLVRYNSNGSLDTTFGGGDGIVAFGFSGDGFVEDMAYSMALDTAGRAVVAGTTLNTAQTESKLAIARVRLAPDLHRNGKIAFTSDRDGNSEIYVMAPDGSNQTRITNNTIYDGHPAWSPDGRKIAFISQRPSGEYAIFQMNADGTGKTEITPVNYQPSTSPSTRWDISWSPNGDRLVFADPTVANEWQVFVVDADGRNRRFLINGWNPAWSPDGSRILSVTSLGFWDDRIQTIDPDGSDPRILPVLDRNRVYFGAAWSPTGLEIAVSAFDSANTEIFIVNADGSNARVFHGQCEPAAPEGCSAVVSPEWSPDGQSIAFVFPSDIYTKKLEGGEPERLTTTGRNLDPSWQPMIPRPALADFDGDGRSDISVFRPSEGTWYLNRSATGFSARQFGLSTDRLAPADYDGDGKTDIAVFRDGTWYRLNSSDASFRTNQFGASSDIPVPADFTGDGRAELAVYRGGAWFTLYLSNGQTSSVQFGLASDRPVVGDYDGDGRADQAVYRDGTWHLNRSSDGYTAVQFGIATDRTVSADHDGDGKTDLAVYRDGSWYLLQSTDGFATFQFGLATDVPVPADYDGDGRTDAAVFRNGVWYLRQTTGAISTYQFGLAGDRPVPAELLQ